MINIVKTRQNIVTWLLNEMGIVSIHVNEPKSEIDMPVNASKDKLK